MMNSESSTLRISVVVTLLVASCGIVFGLLSGSFSIVFDGIYALVDASMSGLALVVVTLIRRHTSEGLASQRLAARFNMGFWHLEPMVLTLNGTLLCGVTLYALINAIGSLLNGGRDLEFDFAIIYAAMTAVLCFSLAALEFRANKHIRSDFIALDITGWVMSGCISLALLLAFLAGALTQNSSYAWLGPYIDPAVLAVICLFILPIPLRAVRRALAQVLMVAPQDLRERVDSIASDVVMQHGFAAYQAYIAKIGRAQRIELYFIVPGGWPAQPLESWDAIRDTIGEAMGDAGPDRWLTIAFTSDPEWAR